MQINAGMPSVSTSVRTNSRVDSEGNPSPHTIMQRAASHHRAWGSRSLVPVTMPTVPVTMPTGTSTGWTAPSTGSSRSSPRPPCPRRGITRRRREMTRRGPVPVEPLSRSSRLSKGPTRPFKGPTAPVEGHVGGVEGSVRRVEGIVEPFEGTLSAFKGTSRPFEVQLERDPVATRQGRGRARHHAACLPPPTQEARSVESVTGRERNCFRGVSCSSIWEARKSNGGSGCKRPVRGDVIAPYAPFSDQVPLEREDTLVGGWRSKL